MKTLKDITYSLKDIEEKGYGIENNIIKGIDINIIAHFGNTPCLTIFCENIMPYGHYNDISRLGYLLKVIVELFEVEREDGVALSELKNIPCRLIFEGEKAIGIGHFMKDKFILFSDFSKLID